MRPALSKTYIELTVKPTRKSLFNDHTCAQKPYPCNNLGSNSRRIRNPAKPWGSNSDSKRFHMG
jgi:hypothetical protein